MEKRGCLLGNAHIIVEDFVEFSKYVYFMSYLHDILCVAKDMVEVVDMYRQCKEKMDKLN